MLSEAAMAVWGKSDRDTGDSMSLWKHMTDSAAVAAKLWDEWLPDSVKQQIIQGSGSAGTAEARTLVTWLAATHDAGKIHPLFAFQVSGLADKMQPLGLPIDSVYTPEQRIPHSALSYATLSAWLITEYDFKPRVAASYAAVSGGHHGAPATQGLISRAKSVTDALGGKWHEVQKELLDACARLTGAEQFLPLWRERKLSAEVQMLLTGVVIVADWNASDTDLFAYNDPSPTDERTSRAWAQRGLPPAWRAPANKPDVEEGFATRFGLPPGAKPNQMQRETVKVANDMVEPGLLIIEAAMGEGKTEAAFAAAEVFAAKWGLGGVIIGLPTQATSDGMFARFMSWVEKLPDDFSREAVRSIYLAHSKAALNEEFAAVSRVDPIRSVFDNEFRKSDSGHEAHAVIAHQWLYGRKKGLLANFVVATVDQILFSALQSKHVVLRHLALAGKVVIIDEVHAYDAFMNEYMQRVLHWLARYNIPVIMLSATLPAKTRKMLVAAYEGGRAKPEVTRSASLLDRRRTSSAVASPQSELDGNPGYPLIIASNPSGISLAKPPASSGGVEVSLQPMDDDVEHVLEQLSEVRNSGGCVGIICNTVARAQGLFQALSEVFEPDELILNHSRFAVPDRMSTEARIRGLLGPDAYVEKQGNVRPHRLVVVGTQVLEQSLDIDFDLMITDIAPVDLLLQRMGRLHRRREVANPRPEHLAQPVCLVRGVADWATQPPLFNDGSAAVYGDWALLRSAAVLAAKLSGEEAISIPAEIPELVQAAYAAETAVPKEWDEAMKQATAVHNDLVAKKKTDAQMFLLKKPSDFTLGNATDFLERNLGDASEEIKAEAKGMARVRDIEESIEVILMYRDGGPRFLPHLTRYAGRLVPDDMPPENAMAKALSSCTVRLPGRVCQWHRVDRVLDQLEADGVAAWQKSPWLKGQLVLFLDNNFTAVLDGIQLRYDRQLGLLHEKLAEGE